MQESTPNSIWENFEEIARRTPDKKALIYLGTTWTYREFKDTVERLAAALHQIGIGKGDKAVIYMPNIPQWLITFFALQRLNATVVAVASVYTPIDLKYMVEDSGAKTLFCMDTNFGYATQVLYKTELEKVVVTTMVEMLPWWKRFLGKAFDRVAEGNFTLGENIYSFRKLLNNTSSALPPITNEGKDVAVMLYTGGTTGLPKGVPYSNEAFLESAIIHRKVSESLVPLGEGIVLQGGPLYHNLGIMNALICLSLAGETLILTPRVNLDAYFDMIQRYKITNFFGVPALFRMILDHDRIDYYDLSSLKYIFTGGDVLPQETVDRWSKTFHQRLYEAYGITETCGGVAMSPADEDVPLNSAGRIFPAKEVMFVDTDTLEPVPPEEGGELLVYSKYMIKVFSISRTGLFSSFSNPFSKISLISE